MAKTLDSEAYTAVKSALKNVGVEEQVVNNLKGATRLLELRLDTPKAIRFLRGVIPLEDYIEGNVNRAWSKDFLYSKLSEEGAERIRETGRRTRQYERAEELAMTGREKNIAILYTCLTIQDITNVCGYEIKRRAAA